MHVFVYTKKLLFTSLITKWQKFVGEVSSIRNSFQVFIWQYLWFRAALYRAFGCVDKIVI